MFRIYIYQSKQHRASSKSISLVCIWISIYEISLKKIEFLLFSIFLKLLLLFILFSSFLIFSFLSFSSSFSLVTPSTMTGQAAVWRDQGSARPSELELSSSVVADELRARPI